MRRITYLELLNTAFMVVLLVGMSIAMYPHEGIFNQLSFYMLIVAVGGFFTVNFIILNLVLKNKKGILYQPVSRKVSTILINSVVTIWLCFVGFIIYMVLKVRGEVLEVIISVIITSLIAIGLGQYLYKRSSSKTLLPYGISFFLALLIFIVIFALV